MTILGLVSELELLKTLQRFDLNCMHRLEQRKITDFLIDSNPSQEIRERCESLLKKNRMLPRENLTYQVDLFAWKRGHWAALAIEEKDQNGVRKILDIREDRVVIKAVCEDGIREYERSGMNLLFQCKGEAYLSQVFCIAKGIKAKVIPVGVVGYDIQVNSKDVDWAYHSGVFFVNKDSFEWFLNEYVEDKDWIREMVGKD